MDVETTIAILTRIKAGDDSIAEIARQVGMVYNPCRTCLKKLEEDGLVTGYLISQEDRQRKEYWLTK